MNDQYRVFFGFQKEPFAQDLRIEEMMKGPAIIGVKERGDHRGCGQWQVLGTEIRIRDATPLGISNTLCDCNIRIDSRVIQTDMLHTGYRVEEFLKGCTYQSDPTQRYGAGPKEDETCADNR